MINDTKILHLQKEIAQKTKTLEKLNHILDIIKKGKENKGVDCFSIDLVTNE